MFGIVAIGTYSGHIYLIDLRGDDKHEQFSISQPSSLLFVDISNISTIAKHREDALREDKHCCVDLNGMLFFLIKIDLFHRRLKINKKVLTLSTALLNFQIILKFDIFLIILIV